MQLSQEFLDGNLFNWVLLPLLIFVGRSCDVTLATLRNIFLSRNIKKIVPLIGFFEVLLWLVAVSTIMKNLNNLVCYFAFAGGYSLGIWVGIKIEGRLALGTQLLRIITNQDCHPLMEALNRENLGVTEIDALGAKGPVKILLTVVKRKDAEHVIELVNKYHPNAFFSMEDVRLANQGIFPGGDSKLAYIKRIFPVV
jgi:uncharacterized protein YebE (UPF0316 family)